ncbi:MAG: helix-turn-helix domain-containing protein [Bacteroidales bacterium]|nr:helix-turn-helix domain-containing protein [Bacteroidales bacterium]
MNEEPIGKQIKKLIKLKGFKVTEFARLINCSRRTMYEIFQRNHIDTEMLQRMSEVLKINLFEELAEKTEEKIIESEQNNAQSLKSLLNEDIKTDKDLLSFFDKGNTDVHFFSVPNKDELIFNKNGKKHSNNSQRPLKQSYEEKILAQLELLNEHFEKIISLLSEINQRLKQ